MNKSSKEDSSFGSTDNWKKQVKITKHQKAVLLDFLEQNFEYQKGAFKLLPTSTADDKNTLWEDIAQRLNGIGPSKTSNMWRKTCADLRMQIKKKVLDEKELTDEDKRMVKFYGLRLDPLVSSRLVNDRVTAAQKTLMINLMRENYWWNPSTQKLEATSSRSLEWEEIADRLNETGGCMKNLIAWRKCWSDIKCDVGKKFQNGSIPKMLTENEYKIATLYGWLNGEQNPPVTDNPEDSYMDVTEAATVQYIIDPTVVIKNERRNVNDPDPEIIVAEDVNAYDVERLEDDESNSQVEESQEDETTQDERTVYVMQSETQTEPVLMSETVTMPSEQNSVLEQILAAQLRTNELLEKLLTKNTEGNGIQSDILDELKNNSFMMVNRGVQK